MQVPGWLRRFWCGLRENVLGWLFYVVLEVLVWVQYSMGG